MRPGKFTAFVLMLIAAACAGCLSSGTLQVVISQDARYNAESQVLIVHKRGDPIDIQDDLEHRFLKAGFVVKPNLSADLAKKLLNEQRRNSDNLPMYMLEYDYYARKTTFLKRLVFEKFSAKLLNARDRKVLVDARFSGSRSVGGFLDELVDKMTPLLPQ
jgi:hypothetical protein